MIEKIDQFGKTYYDQLPDGYRIASIDDFHHNRRKKIGMRYLIKWIVKENYYQIMTVNEATTATYLLPFIHESRVFVQINPILL